MLQPETASLASGRPCSDRSRARISGKTALKVIASSIRKGNVIEQDGKLYVVLTAENIHPGKGTPVSQIEMRRISDGVKISERYKTTDQVEKATIEDHNFNYLYEDADGFHFMNTDTYDQVQVPKDVVGTAAPYLAGEHDRQAVASRRHSGRHSDAAARDAGSCGNRTGHQGSDRFVFLQARDSLEWRAHHRAAAYRHGNAHRGHDRGRFLRRARQGLALQRS